MRTSYRKPIRKSTPDRDELSGAVAAVTRDIEARLLAAGIHDIPAWNNACADAGLTPDTFEFPEHKLLFKTLVVAADLGHIEWSLDEFLAWNHMPTGNIHDAYPLSDNKVEVTQFYFMEFIPTGIPRYAKMVAELHRVRTLASAHQQRADELLASVFPVHELIDDELGKVVKAKSVTVARRSGRKAVRYVA